MEYRVQYALSWLNAAVLAVSGVLSGAGLVFHPSWLTDDVRTTAGVLTLVCGALAVLLPPVQRTPAVRDSRYLAASAGVLPADVAKRHGLVGPQKPLDTL
jgi:hypothetical protein